MKIPFNSPYHAQNSFRHIKRALKRIQFEDFARVCEERLQSLCKTEFVHLTNSCTGALEIAAHLCELLPGDEVILPSYTFTSTANAIALRAAVPVFIDCCENSMNIDLDLAEEAITSKTKAIIIVHYAGIMCDVFKARAIADRYNLILIEDAAQAIGSTFDGKSPGELSDFATLSFHHTKNVICGEGGCITSNKETYRHKIEILRDKGTNRRAFLRGAIDKYTWCDVGSSYVLSDLNASVLLAQLEEINTINAKRNTIWDSYFKAFQALYRDGSVDLPPVNKQCSHNAHIFYLILNSDTERKKFIQFMASKGIQTTSHYEPLHQTDFAKRYARIGSTMQNTEKNAPRLVRLPIYPSLGSKKQKFVSEAVISYFH